MSLKAAKSPGRCKVKLLLTRICKWASIKRRFTLAALAHPRCWVDVTLTVNHRISLVACVMKVHRLIWLYANEGSIIHIVLELLVQANRHRLHKLNMNQVSIIRPVSLFIVMVDLWNGHYACQLPPSLCYESRSLLLPATALLVYLFTCLLVYFGGGGHDTSAKVSNECGNSALWLGALWFA